MMGRLLNLRRWSVPLASAIVAAVTLNLIPTSLESTPQPSGTSSSAATNDGDRILLADAAAMQADAAEFQRRKIKTILNIRKPLHYGQFVWDEHGVPAGDIWVRVDLSTQILSVVAVSLKIDTAVIMYGADKKPTPVGQLRILGKSENHRSSLYDAAMPYTLRLTNDGVSIHGADVRPTAATHGCVSIPRAFAQRLFQQAKVGDPVTILPEKRASSNTERLRQTIDRI